MIMIQCFYSGFGQMRILMRGWIRSIRCLFNFSSVFFVSKLIRATNNNIQTGFPPEFCIGSTNYCPLLNTTARYLLGNMNTRLGRKRGGGGIAGGTAGGLIGLPLAILHQQKRRANDSSLPKIKIYQGGIINTTKKESNRCTKFIS